MWIYQRKDWPQFRWDALALAEKLEKAADARGRLLGRLSELGFELKQEAGLSALTEEIVRSGEIEGERLNTVEVRSSVARRMDVAQAGNAPVSRAVDSIVEMMMDATRNYSTPLSVERLCAWQASLSPTGFSGLRKIKVGHLRDDQIGPMQVVSRKGVGEIVHFEAPAAATLPGQLREFLAWTESSSQKSALVQAGIAHLWFVTLHPFEDGNGRLSRAITEYLLARDEHSPFRFYSVSRQILKEKNVYYTILEQTQKGPLHVTVWLDWFLACFLRAVQNADVVLGSILAKGAFWQKHANEPFTGGQREMLNRLLDGFIGNLTSSKWAKICSCSQDTANREIDSLLQRSILVRQGAGRSTHYTLEALVRVK